MAQIEGVSTMDDRAIFWVVFLIACAGIVALLYTKGVI